MVSDGEPKCHPRAPIHKRRRALKVALGGGGGGGGSIEIVFVALEIGFRAPQIDFGVLETNFGALRAALPPITTPKKSPGKDNFRATGITFGARKMILRLQGSYVGV